jgi:hypothetical protein
MNGQLDIKDIDEICSITQSTSLDGIIYLLEENKKTRSVKFNEHVERLKQALKHKFLIWASLRENVFIFYLESLHEHVVLIWAWIIFNIAVFGSFNFVLCD